MILKYFYKNKAKYCLLKCDACGEEFEREFHRIKDTKNNYCNRYCSVKEAQKLQHRPSKETKLKMSLSHKELNKRGNKSHAWKGGKIITTCKYARIYNPEHPFSDRDGYVLEHRLVMEKAIGRYLSISEIVHHINGDTLDNKLENLILFDSISEHIKHHIKNKKSKNEIMKGKSK